MRRTTNFSKEDIVLGDRNVVVVSWPLVVGGRVMARIFAAFLLMFSLAGCAGRAPQLEPLVQATDSTMTCDQIIAETKINNEKISNLATEQGWKVTQNVAAGVVGLVIWPVWFGMDWQNAAGKEGEALSQRNEYLGTLAKDRCRPATTASIAPRSSR
jgi:hypothetical protein